MFDPLQVVRSASTVERLVAQSTRVAREQAALLELMVEVAQVEPGVEEFAAEEIAVALTWTRRAAQAQLSLAWDVVRRLPAVLAALSAGAIDVPRAKVICECVSGLAQPLARQVVEQIVPSAGGLTTGQLRQRLERLVLEADPDGLARRRDLAIGARRFVCAPEPDGTAALACYGVPAQRAAAVAERVHAIALATKDGGDPRSMDQLRADVFVGLLDGSRIEATPRCAPGRRRHPSAAGNVDGVGSRARRAGRLRPGRRRYRAPGRPGQSTGDLALECVRRRRNSAAPWGDPASTADRRRGVRARPVPDLPVPGLPGAGLEM